MRSSCQLRRHAAKCVWNHPPGDEIYRKEPLSVFEICGKVFIRTWKQIYRIWIYRWLAYFLNLLIFYQIFRDTNSTAKAFAYLPNFSWTIKLCILTLNHSCSTWWQQQTHRDVILLVIFPKRKIRCSIIMWVVSWPYLHIKDRVMEDFW